MLYARAAAQGAIELAKNKGLQGVSAEAYPRGDTDFAAILTRVRATTPDAFGAGYDHEDHLDVVACW